MKNLFAILFTLVVSFQLPWNAMAQSGTETDPILLVEGENEIAQLGYDETPVWYRFSAPANRRSVLGFTGYPVLEAFVGSSQEGLSIGTANPVDYINGGETEETILVKLSSTNGQALTATLGYHEPVADLTAFGAPAFSIANAGSITVDDRITVTFPNRTGGEDGQTVSVGFYIFKSGQPAPINLGDVMECTGTLGEGVVIDYPLGKGTYKLQISSLHSGNHFCPSADEQFESGADILNFKVTEARPAFTIEPNQMKLVNLEGDETLERHLPMRCGFYNYDEGVLELYPCVGELYAYEEGPFYTDDIEKTYSFFISMPENLVGRTLNLESYPDVKAHYYDIMRDEWLFHATSGTLRVEKTGNGTFSVELNALDSKSQNQVEMRFDGPEAWRWREYGEMRPNPNAHKLTTNGHEYSLRYINSCVLDMSDEALASLWFSDEMGVTTVAQMQQLSGEKAPVHIVMNKSRMNGNYLSFSMTRASSDSLTLDITYDGSVYNFATPDIDGGNAVVNYLYPETQHISVQSMLFSLMDHVIDGRYPNWNLKYEGPYALDNVTGIQQVPVSADEMLPAFNLHGQPVSRQMRGLMIVGRKTIFVE